MAKFNTHGGYFAPTGYFRVDTGGSHEENPNGGVQVGVDPEGTPNLLEEGEPVYNDYVYSDNITADEEILKKYKIPAKFAGKLYSVIADTFVDEAEERPLDPVSNNGLNAMLVRLADAQEEQKKIQQQKELEEELANLSPEELDELEQMLSQQEALEAQQAQPSPEEQMAMEQQMQVVPQEQAPMMQMPVMACGGFIKRYDAGGSTDDPQKTAEEIALILQQNKAKRLIEEAEAEKRDKFVRDSTAAASKYNWAKWRYDKTSDRVNRLIENADNVSFDTDRYLGLLKRELDYQAERKKTLDAAEKNYGTFLRTPIVETATPVITTESISVPVVKEQTLDQDDVTWANGGKINRYPGGGWVNFLNALNEYKVSRNPGGIRGTYRIDTRFPLGSGVDSIKALEDSDYYKGFTDYVLANPTDPNVQSYLKALDEGTASGVAKLFNGDALVDNWQDIYRKRRYDQKGGIYHFNPTSLDDLNSIIAANNNAPVVPEVPKQNIADTILADYNNRTVNDPRVSEPEVDAAINAYKKNNPGPWTADVSSSRGVTPLATFPRYAGAISSGIMGVYDAFQEPDRYDLGYYNPVLPTGQMDLVDPVYNPLDQNMATQTLLASSAGTNRALQNSGLGPSTGAALLASDYNTGRNLGNTFTTVWDANNQRLNNIIAQRNQNASTLGNFNYGINRERAHILNQAALTNLRNSYLQQRLNYEAEAQKYAAIQNQLDNVNKALAGIGRENTYLNQINFDNAYDYAAAPNGVSMYAPRYAKCGGFIKKYKK